MRSPKDMTVIQIDITNACNRTCSNCQRFCGYHEEPFFMDLDTYVKAVDSLAGFQRQVGMIGGEPFMHPDFDEMCAILRKKRPRELCGLYTAMPPAYWRNFNMVHDTFGPQNLNEHSQEITHQPLLVKHEDLGIDRELSEWYVAHCWVQMCWSATVTPWGAYLCEIAAAMDILRGDPHGWPVTSDWWCIDPLSADFREQVNRFCYDCGACIPLELRHDYERITDVSQTWADFLEGKPRLNLLTKDDLQDLDSWLPGRARYAVTYNMLSDKTKERYQGLHNSWSKGRGEKIERVTACVDYDDTLGRSLDSTKGVFDNTIVVSSFDDRATHEVCEARDDVQLVKTTRFREDGAKFNKGKALNDAFEHLKHRQWVCVMDADIVAPPNVGEAVKQLKTMNRSALYVAAPRRHPSGMRWDWDAQEHLGKSAPGPWPPGFFSVFHWHAIKWNPVYPENWPAANGSDSEFSQRFSTNKMQWGVIPMECQHLVPGEVNWKGRVSERV